MLAIAGPSPRWVEIGNCDLAWYETVALGFQLLAARAATGDTEVADFLTANKVTVFGPDGAAKMWPSASTTDVTP